jgi:hypothetical protein
MSTVQEATSSINFDQKLNYVLSKVRFHYWANPCSPEDQSSTDPASTDDEPSANPSEPISDEWKHLRLLDGLALLLVYEPGGDVAATSFVLNTDGVDFYYVKNTKPTTEEAYVKRMVDRLKTMDAVHGRTQTAKTMLVDTLTVCRGKFLNRRKKVRKELDANGLKANVITQAKDGILRLWEGKWNGGHVLGGRIKGAGLGRKYDLAKTDDGMWAAIVLDAVQSPKHVTAKRFLGISIMAYFLGRRSFMLNQASFLRSLPTDSV